MEQTIKNVMVMGVRTDTLTEQSEAYVAAVVLNPYKKWTFVERS